VIISYHWLGLLWEGKSNDGYTRITALQLYRILLFYERIDKQSCYNRSMLHCVYQSQWSARKVFKNKISLNFLFSSDFTAHQIERSKKKRATEELLYTLGICNCLLDRMSFWITQGQRNEIESIWAMIIIKRKKMNHRRSSCSRAHFSVIILPSSYQIHCWFQASNIPHSWSTTR
jgi:hypothetical protein